MRMSLAGTNLPNEQPVNGHVKVLSGHAARRTDERHPTRFMAPMRFKKEMEASHEPFIRKRQRTAALQDADALATAPFRFLDPMSRVD
jgi:hypothetical protein